jgi:division protein CdvB (Snf7/Vps24/ESCRT-III family)
VCSGSTATERLGRGRVVAAVISRLLSLFGIGEQKQPSLKERIDHVIVQLEIVEDKIAEIRYRFEKRSRELFERVVTLMKRGERSRAAVYAGEVSQIRNILKMVMTVENLITMTKERLRTVRDLRELGQALMVFGAALETVRGEVETLHPNLTIVFDEITRKVKSMIVETSIEVEGSIDPAVVTSNALQVLEEAKRIAEERVKESFPEPPVDTVIPVQAKGRGEASGKVAVPVAVGYNAKPRAEEIEKLVLEYIRSHGGYLDLRDFASRYKVSRDEVLRALYRLADKGLIKLS